MIRCQQKWSARTSSIGICRYSITPSNTSGIKKYQPKLNMIPQQQQRCTSVDPNIRLSSSKPTYSPTPAKRTIETVPSLALSASNQSNTNRYKTVTIARLFHNINKNHSKTQSICHNMNKSAWPIIATTTGDRIKHSHGVLFAAVAVATAVVATDEYTYLDKRVLRSQKLATTRTVTTRLEEDELHASTKNSSRILAFSILEKDDTKIEENQGSIKVTKDLNCIATSTTINEEEEVLIGDGGGTDIGGNTTNTTVVLNWSGTHSTEVVNDRYWEPETIQDVQEIVNYCYQNNIPIRPIGSALSPNGIGFNKDTKNGGMMNMSSLDKLINVDTVNQTVTVQAGARISDVIDMIRPYNLTLPNLASISEQQMGGFIQVGAHGTGRCISPVDEYVTQMKLVTASPSIGTITLSSCADADGKQMNGINTTIINNSELFQLAKVGLGCLGIVVEVTIKCIPAHNLIEHTYVLSRKDAKENLDKLLQKHKHMRYMWIPYTDSVVVVTNDPEDTFESTQRQSIDHEKNPNNTLSKEEKLKPFIDLLRELDPSRAGVQDMGFGELRDAVLSFDPLNSTHVQKCNLAEEQYWKNCTGYQIRPSDELLQFDCGGQQWVWEVCFPTGTQEVNNGNDMKFMDDLLNKIEQDGIPAHAPLEQRWSASSSSLMSPAHGAPNGLHSWVGVINYLPSDETTMDPKIMQQQRDDITHLFQGKYCDLVRTVGTPYSATSHWAKLEIPNTVWKLVDLQLFLQQRFPVYQFNKARQLLDPKNLLSNHLIDSIFGKPPTPEKK